MYLHVKGVAPILFLYSMLWFAWLWNFFRIYLHFDYTHVCLVNLGKGLHSNSSVWLCYLIYNRTCDSNRDSTLLFLKYLLLPTVLVSCCFLCVLCWYTTSFASILVSLDLDLVRSHLILFSKLIFLNRCRFKVEYRAP